MAALINVNDKNTTEHNFLLSDINTNYYLMARQIYQAFNKDKNVS